MDLVEFMARSQMPVGRCRRTGALVPVAARHDKPGATGLLRKTT